MKVDKEKLIRAMEYCTADITPVDENDECLGDVCPFKEGGYESGDCQENMIRAALALLREQEPRVVTTADFENNPNLDDGGHLNVWEEYKDGARYGWNTINVNDVRAFTDLRRYWTSRPTEEQRKAVAWDG